ncbi:halocyanin domain-containing protein [Salinibaculum rarum]|uniref:halocyanin domain-containing protein n=1 Tax=Salinibaculum rarum TaxID=3058903 RepID=UPI00265D8940|nr:halocyanin domain-containing protein [Salinibaculum sp. KK48]
MKKTIESVDVDRRTVLRGAGALAVSGVLAGCGGGSDNSGGDVPSEVGDYLDGANNYDGSATDETDADSVTVMVGAGSNNFAFDPAAIRISTGTTVTWEWTGNGGGHNVVAEDETFTSGDEYVSEEGYTYNYTFEETGNYNYYCQPHKGAGMKGAVIVE